MVLLFNKSAAIVIVTYKPTGRSFILGPGEKKILNYSDLGDGVSSAELSEFAYDSKAVYIDVNYSG